MRNLIYKILVVLILFGTSLTAQAQESKELTPAQMEALAKAMDNPLSQIWSLAFQFNQAWVGNNINDEKLSGNVLSFQPILPIPLGEKTMLFARPVFNMITLPGVNLEGPKFFDDHDTEFGDIILGVGLGPQKDSGFLWGAGMSFIFPTATKDLYGSGKYQMGPAAIAFYLGERFLVGTLAQQWWSFAGDDLREETNHASFLCYFIYNLKNNWQLRYNPNISVDWKNKGNEVLWPLGIGVGKTTKLGKMPVKFMLEGQYAVVRPNIASPLQTLPIPGIVGIEAGMEWLVRAQVNFVIPSPFGDINKILKMDK